MVFIFLLIIALFVLPDYYIWHEFISGCVPDIWSIAYWLPTASAVVLMIVAVSGMYSIRRMRIFFGILTCIALPKLLFVIVSLIGLCLTTATGISAGTYNIAGIIVAIGACSVFTYGFVFGWRMLKVRDTTLESSAVPEAFDGYRILQISDLHLGTFESKKRLVRAIVAKVHALRPDIIVFTGDLVNADSREIYPYMDILSNMRATDGIFSILGNHDYCKYSKKNTTVAAIRNNIGEVKQCEAKLGWSLLLNENHAIKRGDESIYIIGVENDSRPPFPSYGNLKKAMRGVPQDAFKVLLSHDPTHWRREVLPKTDIQLTMSGHTHGMQLKIGKFSPSRMAFREWGGIYREGEQTLCVSLGIGGTIPFRLGAWPEINVITLHKR